MNVNVENLINELKETFPNDWGKEVSVEKINDTYIKVKFNNEKYTKADIHKRYIGDEDFPELKYITVADKDVPEMFRIIVEITSSTLIKQRDDYFSLRGYDD